MKIARFSILLGACLLALSSCVKKDFDTPVNNTTKDAFLKVNSPLIAITKSCLALNSNVGYRQLGDTTISGIVVGDDRSGNIYKSIYIQDTSGGGVTLFFDKTYLYNDYPVGRKIYVKLKGLYLVNYNGLPEIVYSADASGSTTALPFATVDSYIVAGPINQPLPIKTVTIDQINANVNNYICNLVRIENVQFKSGSNGMPYSDLAANTNRTIEHCGGANMIIRTSRYADFQPILTPNGKGTVTGIVTAFKTTPQLVIRDTSDVKMRDTRCP